MTKRKDETTPQQAEVQPVDGSTATSVADLNEEVAALTAQLAEAQGNLDEAQESLKKLIFLKHDHIAAYLELAGIYARKHDARRSEQMYSAATELLRALPAGAAVETCQGMTAGELLRHVEELRGAAAVR